MDETVGYSEFDVQSSMLDVRCYPNPIVSTATIHFTLPDAGFVTLEIHDVTGRQIKTIHQGFLQAREHQFRWDAEGMPKGMYLLRLETGGITESRKLLLLK